MESLDAFVDFVGTHAEMGTEIAIHWPVSDSDFAADEAVFELTAAEGLS